MREITLRPDIADFRLFLSIADAGSITRGAALAHLSLAAASERMRSMEAAAGVPLVVRRPRGISLTEAGAAFAKRAGIIIEQHALLTREMRGFASGATGTLRFYANTSACTEFLPSPLASWLILHPTLHVDLEEKTSVEIIEAVLRGDGEAGIVSDAVDAAGLQLHPCGQDNLVLIIPVGHRFNELPSLRLSDVTGEIFIGLGPESALQKHIDAQAAQIGCSLNFRIKVKTFDALCELVSRGAGIGIVPENIAVRIRQRSAFDILSLTDRWARRNLCLCYRDWNILSGSMKSLLSHLMAQSNLRD